MQPSPKNVYDHSEPIMPTRRDLRFKLPSDQISTWHYAGGPIFTTFLNTFSIVLPVGERFFIDSVRAYRNRITDIELNKAVTAFIGQEAMHGREHNEYNKLLFKRVPLASRFEDVTAQLLSFITRRLPRPVGLSATIALEHFTALLADSVLSEPRLSAGAEGHYAALWRWHALEETEHKAVAYDVWKAVMKPNLLSYGLRAGGLIMATLIFWGLVFPVFLRIVYAEGQFFNLGGWFKFFRYTMGDIGMIRRQLPSYIEYFRPGYHPWDHNNREYLSQIDTFMETYQHLVA